MADRRTIDPERSREDKPFDRNEGAYGLDYHEDREAELGRDLPSGTVAAKPGTAGPSQDPAMPPENGRRASFDPETGAVHGSGSGTGGGQAGEDFDSDSAGGDGYPITGGEGRFNADTDLGPARSRD